tara:strand:- start:2995 stop:3873 length:879 start_codon:yes stop_codon:yes gene_type:complete
MMCSGVVASVFKPSDLSDLQAWYDAGDSSTISSDVNGISQWADKSGNNYHAVQTTNTQKPSTGTSPDNGLPAVKFEFLNGSVPREVLRTDAPTWSFLHRTTFIVFTTTGASRSTPYSHNYFRFKSGESGWGILTAATVADTNFGAHAGEIYGMAGISGGEPSNMAAVAQISAPNADILICQQYKTTPSGVSGSYNFIQKNALDKEDMTATVSSQLRVTDPADGQTKSSVAFIGSKAAIGGGANTFSNNSTQNPALIPNFQGTIQEICEYNRLLSDQERNQVMGYLLGKWRVT